MSKARLAAWLGAAGLASAVALTAGQEGTILKVYRDPTDILTACTGETHYIVIPGDILPGAKFTREQCTQALYRSLDEHSEPVKRCAGDNLTTGQKIAFLDAAFNMGGTRFCASSMARKAKAGDVKGSCEALLLYRFAGGKDCSVRSNGCYGIWLRRQLEYKVCMDVVPA